MIKQIKPNSLSHKFLSLIFEPWEVDQGINICDVPWRALKQLITAIAISLAIGLVVAAVVGFIVALLSAILAIWIIPSWLHFGFPMYGVAGWWVLGFGILCFVAVETFEGNIPILPTWLKKSVEDTSPPPLLSIWWKSFKEKTCVKIVVAEEK